nr:MAG TPA: hypothetical protein [Caudoviricetes sp.]
MSEKEMKDMIVLDEIAEKAGGYVDQTSKTKVHYNYRKILEYCKEKNIEPIDLTVRELQRFIVE